MCGSSRNEGVSGWKVGCGKLHGVLEFHEFVTALLSMDDKYAGKLSIADLLKFCRK